MQLYKKYQCHTNPHMPICIHMRQQKLTNKKVMCHIMFVYKKSTYTCPNHVLVNNYSLLTIKNNYE